MIGYKFHSKYSPEYLKLHVLERHFKNIFLGQHFQQNSSKSTEKLTLDLKKLSVLSNQGGPWSNLSCFLKHQTAAKNLLNFAYPMQKIS